MNKFSGVALAIFLQTVQVAQGAGSGDDKDGFKGVVGSLERAGATSVTEVVPVPSAAGTGEPPIRLDIRRTAEGTSIVLAESDLARLGVTPQQLQSSLDQMNTNGIAPEDARRFRAAILRMTDAQIAGTGLTRQEMMNRIPAEGVGAAAASAAACASRSDSKGSGLKGLGGLRRAFASSSAADAFADPRSAASGAGTSAALSADSAGEAHFLESMERLGVIGPLEGVPISEAMKRMSDLRKQATRPDGSCDMAAIVTAMRDNGMPVSLTSDGKIDMGFGASGMTESRSAGPDLSDTFYNPLPNGDRLASDGTLYKPVRPGDEMRIVTNGGRLALDGTQYYAVKPSGAAAAGGAGEATSIGDMRKNLGKNDAEIGAAGFEAITNLFRAGGLPVTPVLVDPASAADMTERDWAVAMAAAQVINGADRIEVPATEDVTAFVTDVQAYMAKKGVSKAFGAGYGDGSGRQATDAERAAAELASNILGRPVVAGSAEVAAIARAAQRPGVASPGIGTAAASSTEEDAVIKKNLSRLQALETMYPDLQRGHVIELYAQGIPYETIEDAAKSFAPKGVKLLFCIGQPIGGRQADKLFSLEHVLKTARPGEQESIMKFAKGEVANVPVLSMGITLTPLIIRDQFSSMRKYIPAAGAGGTPALSEENREKLAKFLDGGTPYIVGTPDALAGLPGGSAEGLLAALRPGSKAAAPSARRTTIVGFTDLTKAVYEGRLDTVRILLAANDPADPKWDVNEPDGEGRTPLLVAVGSRSLPMAELLLANGAAATINHVNGEGRTALGQAVHGSSLPLVTLLLAHGADPAIGKINNANVLAMAVVLRQGGITNALVHKLLQPSEVMLPVNPRGQLWGSRNEKTTLLHVLCLGGAHYVDNIETICSMEDGLQALSIKDFEGKLPEQIMQDPTLKAKMKLLKEGYELFSKYLRLNISKDREKLQRLEGVAEHISKCNYNFSKVASNKAKKILEDLKKVEADEKAAADMNAKVAPILEKILPLQEQVERLPGLMGQLRTATGKGLQSINAQIAEICKALQTVYPKIKTESKDIPHICNSLDRAIRAARGKNTLVTSIINALMPADAAAEKAADAAAAKAIEEERAMAGAAAAEDQFDSETADLDVETLEALSTASGGSRRKLEATLAAIIKEIEDGARVLEQPTEIVSEADMRQALKDKYETASDADRQATFDRLEKSELKRYRDKLKKTVGHSGVLKMLNDALGHGVHPKLIWQMLKYAKEGPLCKLHQQVEAMDGNEAGTYVSGSKNSSLIDGGSTMAGSVGDRDDDFAGMGDVAAIGTGGAVDFEAAPSLRAAASIPVFELPSGLDDDHIRTLQKLFGRGLQDVRDLAANGAEIHALFNALGDRFEAAYDKEATKAGNLRLTDKAAGSASGSGWGATVIVDPKHVTEEFKGPKRHLVNRAAELLRKAGVTKEVVDTLARRRGLLGFAGVAAGGVLTKPAAAGAGSAT